MGTSFGDFFGTVLKPNLVHLLLHLAVDELHFTEKSKTLESFRVCCHKREVIVGSCKDVNISIYPYSD